MTARNADRKIDGGTRTEIDLESCAQEPIRIPGSIQPHGTLIAASFADNRVVQVSENAGTVFGIGPNDLLGMPLSDVLSRLGVSSLEHRLGSLPSSQQPRFLGPGSGGAVPVSIIGHSLDGLVILELEHESYSSGPHEVVSSLQEIISPFIDAIQRMSSLHELCTAVALEIRRITGFDRVLVYRFEQDGTGVVVAEDRNERFPSLQDHHFPASDVPAQARQLYTTNRVRIIPDADYRPSPLLPSLNPITGRPTDLSQCTLRSVSPVHVEYMKNMGTASSMSVSVLVGGELWGLVSCHHATPRLVPFETRATCDLLAQVFALQIAARDRTVDIERRVHQHHILTRLLGAMSDADDFATGLASAAPELLKFQDAAGAAVVSESQCALFGVTPDEQDVRELVDWLFRDQIDVFHTNTLDRLFEPAHRYVAKASGLLAVSISRVSPLMVLWFRPEVVETIAWGGDPRKSESPRSPDGKIGPRTSFATWLETVRAQAAPWRKNDVDAALELRSAVVDIVLRKTEELAALSQELRQTNAELQRSNKELEAFSYSVSHDLRAPLRHIVGFAELLKESASGRMLPEDLKHADTIIESSEYAGRLVDNLLSFSRMGRTELLFSPIDMNLLVRDVKRDALEGIRDRAIEWDIAHLPMVEGDIMMMKLAVLNLLANAIKYTRGRNPARITLRAETKADAIVFSVQDNGVGFDMRYKDKLFGVFQRLHRWEDFEGTGIGLANVRRIIERHGGSVWADGAVERGATFFFSLPIPKKGETTHAETDPAR
ncbi:MAG: GAF domain-containing protein [Bdellovibrionota bacterium]